MILITDLSYGIMTGLGTITGQIVAVILDLIMTPVQTGISVVGTEVSAMDPTAGLPPEVVSWMQG